jgi:hypothetical protein
MVILAALLAGLGGSQLYAASSGNPAVAGQEQGSKWFREAHFGMFIHWGLYSIPAGEWKGKSYSKICGSTHLMLFAKIPVAEYETLAKSFKPTRFDAEKWVRIAKDAGMKYIVFTAKHHDGFAMYDSKAVCIIPTGVTGIIPMRRGTMRAISGIIPAGPRKISKGTLTKKLSPRCGSY